MLIDILSPGNGDILEGKRRDKAMFYSTASVRFIDHISTTTTVTHQRWSQSALDDVSYRTDLWSVASCTSSAASKSALAQSAATARGRRRDAAFAVPFGFPELTLLAYWIALSGSTTLKVGVQSALGAWMVRQIVTLVVVVWAGVVASMIVGRSIMADMMDPIYGLA